MPALPPAHIQRASVTAKRVRHFAQIAIGLGAALLTCSVLVPEVLAFPQHRTIGDTEIYAERPLPAAIVHVLARSDTLLRRSAIYGPGYGRRIFLTDGGWRWHVLALQSSGAFAFTRASNGAVVVNRSDVARDLVFNDAPVAGVRSLSAAIAHERTHGLIRARYGMFADMLYPAWLREGYCDLVSGGGSLSDADADADAATLKAQHRAVPALLYYDGRKCVEAMLRANGGSVDALFRGKASGTAD